MNNCRTSDVQVAVFPFRDLVLYPHASIPMYIFEPAYIQMIEDSLTHGTPIALGIGDPIIGRNGKEVQNALSPRKVMGIGYPQLIERYEDGSLYILLEGAGKVELQNVVQNLPYLVCHAQKIEDINDEQTFTDSPIENLKNFLDSWLEINVPDSAQRETFLEKIKGPEEIVDYLSMFMIQDRNLKQILLEMKSLPERIETLNLLLQNKGDESGENKYYGQIIKNFECMDTKSAVVN